MTELSAALVLTEIGVDMAILENAKHLTSWAGFESANNEIAGKKNSNRIAKPAQISQTFIDSMCFDGDQEQKRTLLCN